MDASGGKTQLSLRVPTGIVESIDSVAQALDRDRTWVMLRALRQYLEGEGADVLREAEGLASLDRGEGVDLDHVLEEADAIVSRAKTDWVRKVG
jgi:predicted transcriptional regulator